MALASFTGAVAVQHIRARSGAGLRLRAPPPVLHASMIHPACRSSCPPSLKPGIYDSAARSVSPWAESDEPTEGRPLVAWLPATPSRGPPTRGIASGNTKLAGFDMGGDAAAISMSEQPRRKLVPDGAAPMGGGGAATTGPGKGPRGGGGREEGGGGARSADCGGSTGIVAWRSAAAA